MIRVPTHRPPTHPGEMLVEEFLTPMGNKESDLAEFIHMPAQRINEIITDRKSGTLGSINIALLTERSGSAPRAPGCPSMT